MFVGMNLPPFSVKHDSLTVRIYGDVAVLRGIADNTGTFRGFPFAGKIRYLRVFVRNLLRLPPRYPGLKFTIEQLARPRGVEADAARERSTGT